MATKKQVKIKYKFKDDYNPVYITGAHGGLSPLGDIVMHFFMERQAVPKSETYDIDDKNNLIVPAVAVEPPDLRESGVRFVENGIVMNLAVAKEIHRWLDVHIKTMENAISHKPAK